MKSKNVAFLDSILAEILPDGGPRQPDEFTVADLANGGNETAIRRKLAEFTKQGKYTRRPYGKGFLYRKAKP